VQQRLGDKLSTDGVHVVVRPRHPSFFAEARRL
jgi:hypothetical protein